MRAFCKLVGTTMVSEPWSKAVARAPLKVVLHTASLTWLRMLWAQLVHIRSASGSVCTDRSPFSTD